MREMKPPRRSARLSAQHRRAAGRSLIGKQHKTKHGTKRAVPLDEQAAQSVVGAALSKLREAYDSPETQEGATSKQQKQG